MIVELVCIYVSKLDNFEVLMDVKASLFVKYQGVIKATTYFLWRVSFDINALWFNQLKMVSEGFAFERIGTKLSPVVLAHAVQNICISG